MRVVPIRVVVADDHPFFRAGLRADLGEGFEIVGEAADAAEATGVIRSTRPDVAAVDLQMGAGGGRAVITDCAGICPIVIVTASEAEADLLDTVALGAVGYLVKSVTTAELRDGLAAAAAGEPVVSPHLAALIGGDLSKAAGRSALSKREREVLGLVARGWTYREIGEELYISARTVENHVANTMAKLHLTRRADLVRFAVNHGIE